MTCFSTPIKNASLSDWPPLKLYLRDSGRQTFFVDDLVYLHALANYSWLNWVDGRRMLMPRTLKYYVPKLPSGWFVRVHRNCVVNCRYIVRLERTDIGGLVYMSTGDVLTISRRRWSLVRRHFTRTVAAQLNSSDKRADICLHEES